MNPNQPISLPPMPPSFEPVSPRLAAEMGHPKDDAEWAEMNRAAMRTARDHELDLRWEGTQRVFEGIGDEINAIWEYLDQPWWKRLFKRPNREALLEAARALDVSS